MHLGTRQRDKAPLGPFVATRALFFRPSYAANAGIDAPARRKHRKDRNCFLERRAARSSSRASRPGDFLKIYPHRRRRRASPLLGCFCARTRAGVDFLQRGV